MKCWVCSRQARGYGHTDNRYGTGNPRRYPIDWVFCSHRCQDAFHSMYGNWVNAHKFNQEVEMIDASDVERTAMRSCLRAFGDVAGDIGFEKPLGAYSEKEALQVIESIVTRYTESMVAHHAEAKYPPVRGMKPMVDDPFADPWSDAAPPPSPSPPPSPGSSP